MRTLVAKCIEEVVFKKQDLLYLNSKSKIDSKDRGLFEALFHGILKEWFWLDALLGNFATNKKPTRLHKIWCFCGAYQLLFLDRIPAHAVFSELKNGAKELGLVDAQISFAHAFLKHIEKEKDVLIKQRETSIKSEEPEFWIQPPSLLDALTVVTEKNLSNLQAKKVARKKAVSALMSQVQEPSVFGYALESEKLSCKFEKVDSLSLRFETDESFFSDLRDGKIRVQGRGSRKACDFFSNLVLEKAKKGVSKIRILEMSAGKGGKCISTLELLKKKLEKENIKPPKIIWHAVDPNPKQLEIFKNDTLPLVPKILPDDVSISFSQNNWSEDVSTKESFDLIWIDAPCTGFGVLDKYPQIRFIRGENAYAEAQKMGLLQQHLCQVALDMNPETVFYSVCTMTRPETVMIEEFLSGFGKTESCWTLFEEGFYWVVLKRR